MDISMSRNVTLKRTSFAGHVLIVRVPDDRTYLYIYCDFLTIIFYNTAAE